MYHRKYLVPIGAAIGFLVLACLVEYSLDGKTRFWIICAPALSIVTGIWFAWGRGYQAHLITRIGKPIPAPVDGDMWITVEIRGTKDALPPKGHKLIDGDEFKKIREFYDKTLKDLRTRRSALEGMLCVFDVTTPLAVEIPQLRIDLSHQQELNKNLVDANTTLIARVTAEQELNAASKRVDALEAKEQRQPPRERKPKKERPGGATPQKREPVRQAADNFPRREDDDTRTCELCGHSNMFTRLIKGAILEEGGAPQDVHVHVGRGDVRSKCEQIALAGGKGDKGTSTKQTEATKVSSQVG